MCKRRSLKMIEYLILYEIGNARQTVEVEVHKRTGSRRLSNVTCSLSDRTSTFVHFISDISIYKQDCSAHYVTFAFCHAELLLS